jgi:hypothetical protein
MYCTKCGKRFADGESICSKCGAEAVIVEVAKKETPVLAIIALVLSIISPLLGFGLGMIGIATYESKAFKDISARAITISVSLFFVLCVATIFAFYII